MVKNYLKMFVKVTASSARVQCHLRQCHGQGTPTTIRFEIIRDGDLKNNERLDLIPNLNLEEK